MDIFQPYLRPKKAAALQRMYQSPFPRRRDLQVQTVKNAVILPLREEGKVNLLFGMGGIVDAQGDFVTLSGIPNRLDLGYPFQNPEMRDAKVVYCGYLVNQWGHFLVEGVTRLWYFFRNDPSIDKYVFFLDEGQQREISGNYRRFLELFGIWDRLEFVSRPTRYREIVIPEMCYSCQRYYSQEYLNIFDRVAQQVSVLPEWEGIDKIFFSRSKFSKASELEFGFSVMDDFFARNGYTVLYPETTPLDMLIACIRKSKSIASFSGSVQHNMLFAKPGQSLIILERWTPNTDYQVDVNRLRQLEACYIDSNLPIYPVNSAGPFIQAYNDNLRRFAEDHRMQPPGSQFLEEKYLRKLFCRYMKAYWEQYQYQWFMLDWYDSCADYLVEAYQAGFAVFGDYLTRRKPFHWYHHLLPHFLRPKLRALLGKD